MTQKEAEDMLGDTKVCTDRRNCSIQEKLFELGYRWGSQVNNPDQKIITDTDYLFIGKDKTLSLSNNYRDYRDDPNKEIYTDDILNITIDKCAFKPFEEVLIKGKITEGIWHPAIFGFQKDGKYEFTNFLTLNKDVIEIIPFKGNEKFMTTNTPLEDIPKSKK